MQRIPPPTQALINQEMQWALGKNPENPNWEQSPQKRSSQARIAQGRPILSVRRGLSGFIVPI